MTGSLDEDQAVPSQRADPSWRTEAAAAQPPMGREIVQSFTLMGLMAGTLAVFVGLGLLAVRVLG
jgi:hypothetical protein